MFPKSPFSDVPSGVFNGKQVHHLFFNNNLFYFTFLVIGPVAAGKF